MRLFIRMKHIIKSKQINDFCSLTLKQLHFYSNTKFSIYIQILMLLKIIKM
jgi:hypothetical protein